MSRWPNVFALDFVPRLTVDPDYQDMMRQEFRRVAARMGVKYTPIAEYFPVKDLDLWSRDGVHLSDSVGMPILERLPNHRNRILPSGPLSARAGRGANTTNPSSPLMRFNQQGLFSRRNWRRVIFH
ncbi:hypothetical protein CesoFtcFv8_000232 [Champsocephalus esox]|uniref:Uncharacterized protein n=1 Tax=Champsocephalus esox TaxID=159716 RepID=A0AAN8E1H8_9TELE|nr:hypothetical protein CesoFtcFv8_025757 [Champsocephalus esox]KAK5931469.1 hypothetical protein CesoFtcFv8_000232 [Champsocephalus esox]